MAELVSCFFLKRILKRLNNKECLLPVPPQHVELPPGFRPHVSSLNCLYLACASKGFGFTLQTWLLWLLCR